MESIAFLLLLLLFVFLPKSFSSGPLPPGSMSPHPELTPSPTSVAPRACQEGEGPGAGGRVDRWNPGTPCLSTADQCPEPLGPRMPPGSLRLCPEPSAQSPEPDLHWVCSGQEALAAPSCFHDLLLLFLWPGLSSLGYSGVQATSMRCSVAGVWAEFPSHTGGCVWGRVLGSG